jgi:hypothetical protein
MQHKIENVEALWPRINRTYKFDSIEKKSMPCDPHDPMAAYEVAFRLSPNQAKELWGKMLEAYKAKAEPAWPAQPINPFKKEEDTGCFIAKAKLRGNYGGELSKGVAQYDMKGNKLAPDFMLTTGSKVNIAVTMVPYNMREAGVSMRLRAVQVVEYKEMEEQNPFGALDNSAANEDPFGLPPVAASKSKPIEAKTFDDEIPF